jgi:hypothetical protein
LSHEIEPNLLKDRTMHEGDKYKKAEGQEQNPEELLHAHVLKMTLNPCIKLFVSYLLNNF